MKAFLQVEPTPTPVPSGGNQGVSVGPDLGKLVEGFVTGIREALTWWAADTARQAGEAVEGGIRSVWDNFWISGVNLLATPRDLTIDFGPGQLLRVEIAALVASVTLLAAVLLGLRVMFQSVTGRGGFVDDAVNGFLMGTMLAGSSLVILTLAFNLTILMSNAFGRINYAPAMQTDAWPNIALGIITVVIMLIYGWRLWVRSAYRIVLLMMLSPFAPLAGILWAIPQARWISLLYWVTVGGWLAGGFLAIAALSLGLQIATVGNTNGIVSLIFGVALVQVAHDLMALLPRAFANGGLSGSPAGRMMFGGSLGGPAGMAAAAAGVAGAAGAVGTAIGALPSGEQAGYGY